MSFAVLFCMMLLQAPATAPATQPGEIRRGMAMDDPPESRYERYYERLARQIEPDLHGDPKRLDLYVRYFEREIIHDKRVFAFDVAAKERADGVIELTGLVEFAEHAASLESFLNALGFEKLENRVTVGPTLPTPLAQVTATRAFIYSSPEGRERREVLNEVLRGETIYLLAARDRSYLCHAPDGYVGWINASDVAPRTASAIDGGSSDPRIEKIIDAAKDKLGLPYVWGGRSDKGVDCSGLVQTSFASQGIHLPRDAEQQASVGKLVATRWHRDGLRRGDLLFFLGRRGVISHTAIYLGDKKLIEASDGGVKISSFDPNDANYAKHRDMTFCFAKRVLE